MAFSREELDWVEAEWAYHLHGRQAFLSREDFLQLQTWEAEGASAEGIVGAMEAYFQRRAKRPRPRAFVALSHLEKDVRKAMTLRRALAKVETGGSGLEGWERVKEPLRSDPRARAAFEAWRRLCAAAPKPDSPGFLDHFDEERKAFRELVARAEAALGPRREGLAETLRQRLADSQIAEGGLVWKRAWEHHWGRLVCEAWNLKADSST